MEEFFVVFAIIIGRKNYLAKTADRHDGSISPHFHMYWSEAIKFNTEDDAKNMIRKLYNPHKREYFIESVVDTNCKSMPIHEPYL